EADRALKHAFEEAPRLKERRFSRARWAEQRDDLALPNFEIHPSQHLDRHLALGEAALQVPRDQHRLDHHILPTVSWGGGPAKLVEGFCVATKEPRHRTSCAPPPRQMSGRMKYRSFIAQHLHRVGARRLVGGIERGEE